MEILNHVWQPAIRISSQYLIWSLTMLLEQPLGACRQSRHQLNTVKTHNKRWIWWQYRWLWCVNSIVDLHKRMPLNMIRSLLLIYCDILSQFVRRRAWHSEWRQFLKPYSSWIGAFLLRKLDLPGSSRRDQHAKILTLAFRGSNLERGTLNQERFSCFH